MASYGRLGQGPGREDGGAALGSSLPWRGRRKVSHRGAVGVGQDGPPVGVSPRVHTSLCVFAKRVFAGASVHLCEQPHVGETDSGKGACGKMPQPDGPAPAPTRIPLGPPAWSSRGQLGAPHPHQVCTQSLAAGWSSVSAIETQGNLRPWASLPLSFQPKAGM